MDDDYFTTFVPEEIATHIRMSSSLDSTHRVKVHVRPRQTRDPGLGTFDIVIVGFDYLSEWAVIQRYRTDAHDRATDSEAVNKIVFPWLEQHRDEPFFLYAHTTDPHAPYRPPAGFLEKYANPAETPEFDPVPHPPDGFFAVLSKMDVVLKGSNIPVAASEEVLASNA